MKINKQLNLVVPCEDGDEVIYIHSSPISTEVFEKYHRVIAKAFSVIYSEGLNVISAPRVAAMVLREVAEEMGRLDDINNGLLNEIKRLSNVSILESNGWVSLPLDIAEKRSLIEPETMQEAMNKIVFFILCSAMHTGKQKIAMLEAMAGLWEVALTSLNATEYNKSLPILTEIENSAAA